MGVETQNLCGFRPGSAKRPLGHDVSKLAIMARNWL